LECRAASEQQRLQLQLLWLIPLGLAAAVAAEYGLRPPAPLRLPLLLVLPVLQPPAQESAVMQLQLQRHLHLPGS
jgi:hypothetical protein